MDVHVLGFEYATAIDDETKPCLTSYLENGGMKAKGCQSDKDCLKICKPSCSSKNCVKGVCICGC